MIERKELGRIAAAAFGLGGYDDAMIGLSLTFESNGWSVNHFDGFWSSERNPNARWTEEERLLNFGAVVTRLSGLLRSARTKDVADLVGTPVEITFVGDSLESFRILTEVLP